ncbi:retrovirus-like pol polyprotein [Lasius niger]|uniref:RNA-directed DNA polymerase n=1 Tax=Lasius niger TaxID=67767 RepID=A0A0J7KBD2_LASNI|nr:retrovirus-like pol polyprotein [Lasius niger]
MLAIVRSVERFHIYLYGLHFTVVTDCHANGKKMAHVDALSRVVHMIDALPLEKELEYRQLQDPRLKFLARDLEYEGHDKFDLIDGLVFRKAIDKPRFVIPESMVTNIIRVYHGEMAHCGVEKTVRGIGENYWFPSLRKRVQNYIDNCLVSSSNSREESVEGFKHILVVVDAFSRFTWLFAVKSTTSKETIKCLSTLFQTVAAPRTLITDRGTAFTSQEFAGFIKNFNIVHHLVAVTAPWANGLVERVNRAAPAKILFGVEHNSQIDSNLINFLKELAQTEFNHEKVKKDSRELAIESTQKIKDYNKIYYDERHRKPSIYKEGDYVLIRDATIKPGEDKKLKPRYRGPYVVAKALNKNRYVIRDIPGFNITSKPYDSILSPDRLKLWVKPVASSV